MSHAGFKTEDALNERLDKAIIKVQRADGIRSRKEQRQNLSRILYTDLGAVKNDVRLAWLQRGQKAYMDSVFQETHDNLTDAIEDLVGMTTTQVILYHLAPKEIAPYADAARQGIWNNQVAQFATKGNSAWFAHRQADQIVLDASLLGFMDEKDRLPFTASWLDSYIDLAEKNNKSFISGVILKENIPALLKNSKLRANLSHKDVKRYVSDGMSHVIDATQRLGEDLRLSGWGSALENLADNHQIAPFTDEKVLKRAGYLDLTSDNPKELRFQAEIILDFLAGNPDKRQKYNSMVQNKADVIESNITKGKFGPVDINDPAAGEKIKIRIQEMQSNYHFLKKTLQHERLADPVPVV